MADVKLEQGPGGLTVADISSAIALGLQRAIDARPDHLADKILIYGGNIDFKIQVMPQGAQMIGAAQGSQTAISHG